MDTTLGALVSLRTGKLDVNAGVEDGEFPFFTCSRETYKIDVAAYSGKSVIVAGNGDLNVKYYDGEFNAYQRTYILQAINELVLNPKFLFHFMDVYLETLRNDTQGSTIQYLKKAQFTEAPISLPPLAEQKRIVDVVASVDAYIDALQQQVDSARTARNAVLQDLLSAGGVDWTNATIGEFASIQSGFAFSAKDWSEDGYPVVKINNVRDGKVSLESCSFVSHPLPKGAEKFQLHRGDLLITLTGEIGATGTVSVEGPLFLNQRVGKVTVSDDSRTILSFVAYLLSSSKLRSEMWSLGKGNAQLNISPSSIHGLSVNLPPLVEQKRISEIVSSMDEVIQSTEQAVVDAKALRSGLLSDLLSGNHEIPASYDSLIGDA
jgi:type I restriction enzyme S subunit